MSDAEKLARRFHDLYEQMAPGFGYTTREDTRAFIPESPNGKLMIAVCAALAEAPEVAALIREAEARGMERAAEMTAICAADAKDDPGTGWASHSWLMTVCRILESEAADIRAEAAAIRGEGK